MCALVYICMFIHFKSKTCDFLQPDLWIFINITAIHFSIWLPDGGGHCWLRCHPSNGSRRITSKEKQQTRITHTHPQRWGQSVQEPSWGWQEEGKLGNRCGHANANALTLLKYKNILLSAVTMLAHNDLLATYVQHINELCQLNMIPMMLGHAGDHKRRTSIFAHGILSTFPMSGHRASVLAEPSRGLPTLHLVAVESSIMRVGNATVHSMQAGQQQVSTILHVIMEGSEIHIRIKQCCSVGMHPWQWCTFTNPIQPVGRRETT